MKKFFLVCIAVTILIVVCIHFSVFQSWINSQTSNENMEPYVWCAVFALAFVVGIALMIVAAVKRTKKAKRYQKEKSEAERLADEDEQIQQQLAAVKGNRLKKEMIAKKLKRQYVEQKIGKQTLAHKQSMEKWDSIYDWGNLAFKIGLSPLILLLIITGEVFLSYVYDVTDTNWMAILNVGMAFIAALVLTLCRHGYQAFLMWMAFFLYAFGVWHVGGDIVSACEQWMLQECCDTLALRHSHNGMAQELNPAYVLMILTSICFALYGAIKRWAVSLWCVLVFILPVIDFNGLLFGVVSIVKLYLGIPASCSFLLCCFFLVALLAIYCTIPAVVDGWRTAARTSGKKASPAIAAIVWLVLHVLVLVAVCFLLLHGRSPEESSKLLGRMILVETELGGEFNDIYILPVMADLFVSWLVYRYVARFRKSSK